MFRVWEWCKVSEQEVKVGSTFLNTYYRVCTLGYGEYRDAVQERVYKGVARVDFLPRHWLNFSIIV